MFVFVVDEIRYLRSLKSGPKSLALPQCLAATYRTE